MGGDRRAARRRGPGGEPRPGGAGAAGDGGPPDGPGRDERRRLVPRPPGLAGGRRRAAGGPRRLLARLPAPDARGARSRRRAEAALDAFTRAAEAGERFDEPDLAALGRLGRGQALIRLGDTDDGVELLDEAMAAAEAGALSPVVVGVVYCAVIETCHEIFDVRRAKEWTAVLRRWCASHPDLVPFRGQCLVRRAEILEIRGDWGEALEEARRAGELLRLAQGEVAAAAAALRRAEAEAEERAARCRLLPAHGATGGEDGPLDADRVLDWLAAVVDRCRPGRPVLVGHVLGGALAARYAAARGEGLGGLVLVDALGLAPFRPSLRFLLGLLGFQARPTERTYRWFMTQCGYDRDGLRERMGDTWETFVAYNVALARSPRTKAAGRLFRELGLPRILPEELVGISVSTALIWGRHDRALPLRIAEAASERHGWPLHVVEEAADDPFRDRPAAFLRALRTILEGFGAEGG